MEKTGTDFIDFSQSDALSSFLGKLMSGKKIRLVSGSKIYEFSCTVSDRQSSDLIYADTSHLSVDEQVELAEVIGDPDK